MMTVGQHGGRILPVGDGIGATQAGWVVRSLARAAGILATVTVADPFAIILGPPGTQVGSMHGTD